MCTKFYLENLKEDTICSTWEQSGEKEVLRRIVMKLDVEWICLTRDRAQYVAFVNAVMNIWVL
jgi:hypothetical protein